MCNSPLHKKATISDVAKSARTGKTSVSRYLNGEFSVLSDSIKERIEQAITSLNYRPNQMARSLKRGSTKLIAFILPDITNPYSIEVMGGLEKACQDNGYTLLICNSNKDINKEKYYLQLLIGYNVEGVIIHSISDNKQIFTHYPCPLIFIDRKVKDLNMDIVGLDNIQSSAMATMHLINAGFSAILFITEPINDISTRLERINTFKQIIEQEANVVGHIVEISSKSNSLEYNNELDQHITQFYQQYHQTRKAIISINGSVTLHIALAMKRLNLSWNNEIGFLGFDDPKWAAVIGDGITTIKQPTYQIGYSALELLLKRIHLKQTNVSQDDAKTVLYPGELMIRNSTNRYL